MSSDAMQAPSDNHDLQRWVGRSETREEHAAGTPLAGLAALLDHAAPPWTPGELPPLAHWLYFLPRERQSLLASDGHPQRGDFLPAVALPRRMWAGSRLRFLAPIPVEAAMVRRSTISAVSAKTGRQGPMVFVTVRHEVSVGATLALLEEQDIVYRGPARTGESGTLRSRTAEPRASEHTRRCVPDPVQLFRFSALTFNAHRIHYDRDYARDVEGYPGLVVHGPWIAMLLMDHFLRCGARHAVNAFSFRAQQPLFDTSPFDLCLSSIDAGADLWAIGPDGAVAMTAAVTCRTE